LFTFKAATKKQGRGHRLMIAAFFISNVRSIATEESLEEWRGRTVLRTAM
jgi:hypothetical protein